MKKDISTITSELKREAVVPFWMWNDKLNKEKLLQQLKEIKEKGIKQVIIHARYGLETPYLSEEWFEMVGSVVNEAKKINIGLWIYDELNWPSGYAGGEVLKKTPEFCANHLTWTKNGLDIKNTSWKPAYSNDRYVDVLNPEATDSFIELVYEQYWRRFGKHFGTTILGFFTDEPGMYNNFAGSDPSSIPWTNKLPVFFESKNGYSLEQSLNLIFENHGQKSIETRIDYWDTISLLYQESYFKRLQRWCHQKGVVFIGHVLLEEDLVETAKTQGNFFTTMKYLDLAGYDLIGQLGPSTLIAAKLADSASKVYKLHGVTAETFGIFGWDLTEDEMLGVVKWQAEQGLDVLIPHALFYSLRGERYNDCPPSFMAEKYWLTFDKFVETSRKQLVGITRRPAKVAIYYPIETVWGYLLPNETGIAEKVDYAFKNASYACYNVGATFDYVPAHFILENGLVNYEYLILPKAEILSLEVLEEVIMFANNGGVVVCVDGKPKYATKVAQQVEVKKLWKKIEPLIYFIPLPDRDSGQIAPAQNKKSIKKFLSKVLPPIWLARGVRVAKMFGYKRKVKVNQIITGIETQLGSILNKT